jgi:hypothetical protein
LFIYSTPTAVVDGWLLMNVRRSSNRNPSLESDASSIRREQVKPSLLPFRQNPLRSRETFFPQHDANIFAADLRHPLVAGDV